MYIVKTRVGYSDIEGLGVFAEEDVRKGDLVWSAIDGFDLTFDESKIEHLPTVAKEYLKRYAYRQKGKLHLTGDHTRFTNHSDQANTKSLDDRTCVAARDIKKGEEITCNYREFDEDSLVDLGFDLAAVPGVATAR